MIGHTGFLITARRLAPGTVLPELKRRPSKSDYSDADVEAWTPGALGDRQASPKSLRKRVRAAGASADLSKARGLGAAGESADAGDGPDSPNSIN
jgi:tRNA (adenine57-N1/adenine58-N1)-methyltransferase